MDYLGAVLGVYLDKKCSFNAIRKHFHYKPHSFMRLGARYIFAPSHVNERGYKAIRLKVIIMARIYCFWFLGWNRLYKWKFMIFEACRNLRMKPQKPLSFITFDIFFNQSISQNKLVLHETKIIMIIASLRGILAIEIFSIGKS